MKNKELKYNIKKYAYCLLIAFAFLFISTKSSPFYIFNDWCDANSYFTIGKAITKGVVPYKDLFEQKGPILYFIHAIAYIISNTNFIGVFILEVLSFSIFLYYMSKIIELYCSKKNVLWGIALIACIILSSFVFCSGDSAEEFCISFLSVSLFYFLKYFKDTYPKEMSKKELIINGIMAGCVLWIKYTMLGFWIAFGLFLVISNLINKEYKKIISTCIYYFLGMIVVTVPVIIYFGLNGAVNDLVYTYFYVNMTAYSEDTSILYRLLKAIKYALGYAKHLPVYLIITLLGYITFIKDKKLIPNKCGKVALTLTIILTVIGIYYGNNYRYYFLFLMPFCILGIVSIGRFIDSKTQKFEKKTCKKYKILFLIAFICIMWFLTYKYNPNIEFHKIKREELVQYKIVQQIQEDATLLNYGCIDEGIYTILNTIPNTKYFSMPNIAYEDFPEIIDKQNEYVKNKEINYVLLKLDKTQNSKDVPCLYENYSEILEIKTCEDQEYVYELFEKR